MSSALSTDLYQLTMLKGYFAFGMRETAVFDLFVRHLPPERNFLIAAGLEQALGYLESLALSPPELALLGSTGRFGPAFLEALSKLRFTGDVDALPEGTVLFAGEPMVRVTAPLPEAQLVETRLLNLVHFQTVVASKAARMVLAAPGKELVDFGLRRAHGAEAGLYAARAAFLAGFAATSNVQAGLELGIPLAGSMAHSFIEAHDDEAAAFLHFAEVSPGAVTLTLDTYDTEAAARKVVALAPRLARAGIPLRAVRLDSGDLGEHARRVRRILDAGGLAHVTIFASGGLDERALAELASTAPIDGFGVGTRLVTSADAPSCDCAYKLAEYAGRARRKRSEKKATWPGRKQVYRRRGPDGLFSSDLITTIDDQQEGEPLLVPVMREGRRVGRAPALAEIRARVREQLDALPPELKRLERAARHPVEIAPALRRLAEEVDARAE